MRHTWIMQVAYAASAIVALAGCQGTMMPAGGTYGSASGSASQDGGQGGSSVQVMDPETRRHLQTQLTMSDYLALAEKVTNEMLASRTVQKWEDRRPRLILGHVRNNTDNENIRVKDIYDRIQETVLNSGLVRVVDRSATKFDYIVRTELTSTRQYGKDGRELAFFTLQLKLFKLDGELVGQWSDDLLLGKAERSFF